MDNQTLQEIKDKINIVDLLSGYIPLKKAGVNFKAACPFHNEKTPSLVISPQKQIWHCFGCHEGGDIFGFVMKMENLDFRQTLKFLAEKAGVKLPEYKPQDPKEQNEKDILFRINNFAARFYHQLLLTDSVGNKALKYLEKRGLNIETIKKWQIGFAPDEFHILEKALLQKKVNILEMVKSGVSAQNERGQVYDRFRGRITFPIFDYNGEVVGFSARILADDGKSSKYINSPETIIYQKSKILFGLNFAKNEIRKKDAVVIVEGQMDCISSHQAGITNVVASSGTAFTVEQLQILGRLTKNLILCFDSDAAGQKATHKAIESYLGLDFNIKIIDLGKAKDPDEILKENPEKFVMLIEQAKLFMDYYFEKAFAGFNWTKVEQKKQIAQDLLPLINSLIDPLEQDLYLRNLAEKLATTVDILRQVMGKIKPKNPPSIKTNQSTGVKSLSTDQPAQNLALEKELLGAMLWKKEFLEYAKKELELEEFKNFEIKSLVNMLFLGQNQNVAINSLAKEALFMVESQVDGLNLESSGIEKQLHKILAKFKVLVLKQKLVDVAKNIAQAQSSNNSNLVTELNNQFAKLTMLRAKYEKLI